MKNKIIQPKLTAFDKAMLIFASIVVEEENFGRNVPIKAIVKKFTEDDYYFMIPKKEINSIINKIIITGVMDYSKKGYVARV